MTAKRIIYKYPNGLIGILIPAPNGRRENELEGDWIERIAAKDVPENAVRLANRDISELPQSRRFRDCWRADGQGKPQVDMPLARLQRMDEIRVERNAKLLAADGPTSREVEQETPKAQDWKNHKQALRDLPSSLDLGAIGTPEDLEAFQPVWPEEPV